MKDKRSKCAGRCFAGGRGAAMFKETLLFWEMPLVTTLRFVCYLCNKIRESNRIEYNQYGPFYLNNIS